MPASTTFVASDAAGYERLMGRWSRRLAEPFLDFVGCRDGERILDVGCGTGSLAAALVSRCTPAELRGIDLAAPYVEYARSRALGANVGFEVGDACALPHPDASFDRVLSLLVLHFVPDAPQAIAQMRRVAKPGATVAAAVWDARGGYLANRIFFDTAAALDPGEGHARRSKNYIRPMTRPGELAAAWRAAGLCDVADTALAIRMEFASFDDYWMPYAGKEGPHAEYMATLDAPRRARFLDALRLAYCDGEPDGPRSFVAVAWGVRGTVPR